MIARRKCPIARRLHGGPGCQRPGCECKTSRDSRVCSCCLKAHSELAFLSGSILRQSKAKSRLELLEKFETEILADLEEYGTKPPQGLAERSWWWRP